MLVLPHNSADRGGTDGDSRHAALPVPTSCSGTGARAELTMSSTTPVGKTNASDTMSPANDSGSNAKRKSDDGPAQPRAKRNRYISIACNECKRRKIKCNGQTPCQRCGNLNLDCQYSPNCCNNFKESDE